MTQSSKPNKEWLTTTKAKSTKLGGGTYSAAIQVAGFVNEISQAQGGAVALVSVTPTTSLGPNAPKVLSCALPVTHLSAFFQAVVDELSVLQNTGEDSSSLPASELQKTKMLNYVIQADKANKALEELMAKTPKNWTGGMDEADSKPTKATDW